MCLFKKKKKQQELAEVKKEETPREVFIPNGNKYPLVLYLNQKFVFDILAVMQKGLTLKESEKTTEAEQEEKATKYGGKVGIGVSNVFTFLKGGIDFEGGHEKTAQTEKSKEVKKERIYTPNSLFAIMREKLFKENLVTTSTSELLRMKTGAFIETRIVIRKNPLFEVLDSISSIGETANFLTENPKEKRGVSELFKQFNKLARQLGPSEESGAFDMLGSIPTEEEKNLKVVLTLDKAYLNDPTSFDIIDAEYYVLAKISKVLPEGSTERIDLLRKSKLGKLRALIIDRLLESLDEFIQTLDVGIEKPTIEISPPAIQLIPVAIFA